MNECEPHDWTFMMLFTPLIIMMWLIASGLVVVWWRLVISPGIKDGTK